MAGQLIEGINRSLCGTWSLETRDAKGSEDSVPAAGFYKTVTKKVDTEWCPSAKAVDSHLFETELQDWNSLVQDSAVHPFSHLVSSTRHGTYEFTSERRRVLVPASLMIAALFSPTRYSFPYMLWPLGIGLEALCVPEFNNGTPRVLFSPNVPAAAQSLNTSLLSWAFSFPSARLAWSSIFEHATRGALNICLPKIRLVFNASFLEADDCILLTSVRSRRVTALEAPYDFAKMHPLAFDVDSLRNSRFPPALIEDATDESLISFSSERCIADTTWEALVPLLTSARTRGINHNRLRLSVEFLWHKHKTGAPWSYFSKSNSALVATARWYLKKWRDSGAWEQARAILAHHEPLQTSPSYYQTASRTLGRKFLPTPLTDAQWASIDHLFTSGMNINREIVHVSRRILVDAIHQKFHSGVSWKSLRVKQSESQKILNYYHSWMRSGVWNKSIAILTQQGAFSEEKTSL